MQLENEKTTGLLEVICECGSAKFYYYVSVSVWDRGDREKVMECQECHAVKVCSIMAAVFEDLPDQDGEEGDNGIEELDFPNGKPGAQATLNEKRELFEFFRGAPRERNGVREFFCGRCPGFVLGRVETSVGIVKNVCEGCGITLERQGCIESIELG